MCDVLGLAERTYYAAKQRSPSVRTLADRAVSVEIRRVWESNYRVYGAKRVWLTLRREGLQVARCTVERLMSDMSMAGVQRGRRPRTTIPDSAAVRSPDLVDRRFIAQRPDELWVTDITYVSTPWIPSVGKLAVCGVRSRCLLTSDRWLADRTATAHRARARHDRNGDLATRYHKRTDVLLMQAVSSPATATPNASPTPGSPHQSDPSEIRTTTRWLKHSTAPTKPNLSIDADPGELDSKPSSPPSNGSTGTTRRDFTARSATSHPSNTKPSGIKPTCRQSCSQHHKPDCIKPGVAQTAVPGVNSKA
jgi:hypothetical protein